MSATTITAKVRAHAAPRAVGALRPRSGHHGG